MSQNRGAEAGGDEPLGEGEDPDDWELPRYDVTTGRYFDIIGPDLVHSPDDSDDSVYRSYRGATLSVFQAEDPETDVLRWVVTVRLGPATLYENTRPLDQHPNADDVADWAWSTVVERLRSSLQPGWKSRPDPY